MVQCIIEVKSNPFQSLATLDLRICQQVLAMDFELFLDGHNGLNERTSRRRDVSKL
jgi:hypothetical protein